MKGKEEELTLASEGAGDVLGLEVFGHVAVQVVDVVDTGNEGSNGVLGIQAALASLQVQLGNTVRVGVALEAGLGADSVLVTEVLLPRGGIGDVRGGHCGKVFVV